MLGRLRAHGLAVVVVHPERVDGGGDDLEVARLHHRLEPEARDILKHILGVRPAEDRVEEPTVELTVDATGGVEVTLV